MIYNFGTMKEIKIFIKNINPVLLESLLQQIENSDGSICNIDNPSAADLFLVSSYKDIEGYISIPRFVIESKKYRLGDILAKIVQIATHPLQYIEDISIGNIVFSPQEKLIIKEGREVTLTDKEVDILYYLIKNIGVEVAKDRILKDVWEYQEGVDTHTLETHIYRLRQKIENNADSPDFLITKEQGYILNV